MNRILALGLAGGLVVAVNLLAIGGALYNRSGEPPAPMVLTERELPMETLHQESPALYLRLRWTPGRGGGTWREPWLDREKLAALGFDCGVSPDHPAAREHYEGELPRQAFIVFDYDGDAWQAHLEAKRDVAPAGESERRPDREFWTVRPRIEASRLLAVDAGVDPEQLRSRYPDRGRFLITRGVVEIRHVPGAGPSEDRQGPEVHGWIKRIVPATVHVPPAMAYGLQELPRAEEEEPPSREVRVEGTEAPRYEVTLHYGRRHEPWISSVRILPATGSQAPAP